TIINSYKKYFNELLQNYNDYQLLSLDEGREVNSLSPVIHNSKVKKVAELRKQVNQQDIKYVVFFDKYPKGNSWLMKKGPYQPHTLLVLTFSPKRFYLKDTVKGLGLFTKHISPLECVK